MANALFEAFRAFASASLAKEVIEDQVLPGLKLLMSENGGFQVEPSFKTMVQSMIQDMKNNITAIERNSMIQTKSSNLSHAGSTNQSTNDVTPTNISSTNNNNSNNLNNLSTDNAKSSSSATSSATKKNLFEKLDAAASMTASITSSLKVDFDKALPKWTWKNR
jgi:hypothetical protein